MTVNFEGRVTDCRIVGGQRDTARSRAMCAYFSGKTISREPEQIREDIDTLLMAERVMAGVPPTIELRPTKRP